MINIVTLFRRKAGMSVADFQTYWRDVHAPIVCEMPGVRRYVQSHTLPSGYANRTPAVDGVAELWFDNSESLRRLVDTAELKATRLDHAEFMDTESYIEIMTEDVVIKDGAAPENGVKNIELVKKRPDLSAADFHRHWIEQHGPLGAAIPQVRRYVQCHTRAGAYRGAQAPALDGVALTWFTDTSSMRAAAETREYALTRADEGNFVSIPLDFVITTENVVIDSR